MNDELELHELPTAFSDAIGWAEDACLCISGCFSDTSEQ